MTGIVTSTHAAVRLAQRAVSASDLEWALRLWREVDDGPGESGERPTVR